MSPKLAPCSMPEVGALFSAGSALINWKLQLTTSVNQSSIKSELLAVAHRECNLVTRLLPDRRPVGYKLHSSKVSKIRTRAGLRCCRWTRPRHAARLAALARS